MWTRMHFKAKFRKELLQQNCKSGPGLYNFLHYYCDIDIYLDVSEINTSPAHKNYKQNRPDEFHQPKAFNRITRLLYRSKQFSDVYAIRAARVPIIKCKHNDTGFSIDINVSYPSSRENTQFISDLVRSDERIHELMLFMKLWAKNAQIIARDNMNSYCLITMVIFYLQQPLKQANKPREYNNQTRILKSIKELQENCLFHIVQGVNYAYDLASEENRPQIPSSMSTWDLIKGFFDFYEKFNFEDHIISPYYGRLITKANLTNEIYNEYNKQLRTITQYLKGEQAKNLQIEFSMCVQDAFCLNQNTAKSITPQSKQYILLCLQNAKKICENPKYLSLAELYEQLLFDTVKIKNPTQGVSFQSKVTPVNNVELAPVEASNDKKLFYTIMPTKPDLRLIAGHFPKLKTGKEVLHCWCKHYVEAIAIILTKIYSIDMYEQSPTQQKQQKLDKENKDEDLNRSWVISCTIDLWSNRCFQKKLQTNFMTYQLEQTERLHNLRRQDPNFSVTLNCNLKVNILPDNMGLEVKIELLGDAAIGTLSKKSPLRKFFNVFKNTLQNWNLNENLNVEKTNVEASEEQLILNTNKENVENSEETTVLKNVNEINVDATEEAEILNNNKEEVEINGETSVVLKSIQ